MDAAWGAIGTIAVALIGLASGYATYRYKLSQHSVERFSERESSFEVAQSGYRACYRKFLVNVAACHGAGKGIPLDGQPRADVTTLLDNFWEASFAGDPAVITGLEAYWSAEQRAAGKPPAKAPPLALLEAMRKHGIRSLKEQDEAREGFLAAD